MKKIDLSVVIVTRNEIENIAGCIHSVDFAREIIVVDMFSTDGTDKIAKKLGCRVLKSDGGPLKILTYNKNLGFSAATSNWVFCLDADERITKKLKLEISEIVEINSRSFDCYKHKSINVEFGLPFDRGNIVRMMGVVRLFRKGFLHFDNTKSFDGESIFVTKGIVGNLNNSLVHDSHKTLSSFINKVNLYTDKEALVRVGSGMKLSKNILITLPIRMLKEFIIKYFKWGLYRYRFHGLITSFIFVIYEFLVYAKCYELMYLQKHRKKIRKYRRKYNLSPY